MKKEFGYVTDREGNAVAGAEVYIRKQSDNTLASLFSDDGSTATSNPLTTDNDGEWSAYWADGVYKIQVFVDGVQQQEVNQHQHFDIDGFTAFGISLSSAADAAAAKALLDLEPGTDVQAYDAELAQIAGLADPNADRILFWDDSASSYAFLTASTGLSISTTSLSVDSTAVKPTESFIIACSDETTALSAGTAKVTLRMPYAFTVTAVYASLTTAQTSGNIFTVDINEAGTSILSTKLTIDNGEDDSDTATTPAVISDASLASRAKITIDIDQIGDGTAKGLKVTLVGTRT